MPSVPVMKYVLRLLEDRLPPSADPVLLPAANRVILVLSGALTIEGPTRAQLLRDDCAWLGDEAIAYLSGKEGATLLRWELVAPSSAATHDGRLRSAPKTRSEPKLSCETELDSGFDWLMRCDRVAFPKGGEALLHVHQGPGIRCTTLGEMQIDSEGHQHRYPVGSAWFEAGVDVPVYARASATEETAFVRCMLLPRSLKGRSSVRYVRREDDERPKLQSYRIYGERFIELPG